MQVASKCVYINNWDGNLKKKKADVEYIETRLMHLTPPFQVFPDGDDDVCFEFCKCNAYK